MRWVTCAVELVAGSVKDLQPGLRLLPVCGKTAELDEGRKGGRRLIEAFAAARTGPFPDRVIEETNEDLDELVAEDGLYARLAALQFRDADPAVAEAAAVEPGRGV